MLVPNCLLRVFDLVIIQCHLAGVVTSYLYKVTSVTLAYFLKEQFATAKEISDIFLILRTFLV